MNITMEKMIEVINTEVDPVEYSSLELSTVDFDELCLLTKWAYDAFVEMYPLETKQKELLEAMDKRHQMIQKVCHLKHMFQE